MTSHLESTLHITGKKKSKPKKDPYKCEFCDYMSENICNMKVHVLNNHKTKEDRKIEYSYYCDICDFGTNAESIFKKHIDSNKHKQFVEYKSSNKE
jgi:hypothetical protein